MMMQPIRQRILEILKERGVATVAELGRELQMAPVSVRHHLDILLADGLVYSPGVHRRGRVGRPQQIYALTPAASRYFPNNFQGLSDNLLDELKIMLQPAQLVSLLQNIAAREAAGFSESAADKPFEERLSTAIAFLSQRGYLARWEKKDGHYFIHAFNCPYAGVADGHHELCEMDMALINQLLGVKVRRISRIAEGDGRCSYMFEAPEVSEAVAG